LHLRPTRAGLAIDSIAHLPFSYRTIDRLALGWWKKIEESRPASALANRREYAAAAINSNEIAIASAQIDVLASPKTGGLPPRTWC